MYRCTEMPGGGGLDGVLLEMSGMSQHSLEQSWKTLERTGMKEVVLLVMY